MLSSALPGNTSEEVDVQETQDYDVVVVGAGCSGTNTAVRAAQAGLRVALVEKTSHLGGASLKSWAPSIPNSSFAKADGVTTDTEPIIQNLIADSHWRMNAAAVRKLVNSSSAAVDWMAGLGWNFTYLGMGPTSPRFPNTMSAGRFSMPWWKDSSSPKERCSSRPPQSVWLKTKTARSAVWWSSTARVAVCS